MASRDFELERCPFCGGAALLKKTSNWDYFVRCGECGAKTRQYHENDVGAVSAWNARTAPEIVRCKDCRFCRETLVFGGMLTCDLINEPEEDGFKQERVVNGYDFCSRGVRC